MVYLPHWPIPSTLGKKQINYETVFERMSAVLQKLNNPHHFLPPVIHVAGTNGKGSVCALLAQIFSCAGYKTSIYTSPHLLHCNERIVLNGNNIDDGFLYEVLETVRLASQDIDLTFMESITIAAFLAFAQSKSDILIVECGMGGRIDATNIIANKLATVITSISYDHQEYLGDTLVKIAMQKAMIARQNTPLIIAKQMQKDIHQIINLIAKDSIIYSHPQDFDYNINNDGSFDFYWQNEDILPTLPAPNLLGQHQYDNFSVALATIMAISRDFYFNYQHLAQAITTVKWPSRLQKINNKLTKMLSQHSAVFLDGAHNVGGALALANWLNEQQGFDNKFVICGFSKNKCKPEFLQALASFKLIAVRVSYEPYPEDCPQILEIAKRCNIDIVDGKDVATAIEIISLQQQESEKSLVVICGSLHLAREVQ